LNLLVFSGAFITYSSWVSTYSWIGFIFCVLYYVILEALLFAALVAVFSVVMVVKSRMDNSPLKGNPDDFYVIHDADLQRQWSGKKMPMETFIEAYFDEKIDLKPGVDLHEMFKYHRNNLFKMCFTTGHVDFFIKKFLVQTAMHTKVWDYFDVATTYDRGNDFYNSFLGESMVYTSGIFDDESESLEKGQENKMNMVARKINMQANEKHLDIGCGWGTFARHCARHYKTDSLGITISQAQVKWAKDQIKSDNIKDISYNAKIEYMDYRNIPSTDRYDKITCLEMAEHVGVKNFQTFCRQVNGLLNDEGLFYLQICGLRPSWQFEDFVWGLFMAKYIFPGADASCPASWVTTQLEQAGFEIHSVENVSIHYVVTIYKWYQNWVKHEKEMREAYGERLYRIWIVFLGWSVLAGGQGTSQCYQIVANKNLSEFKRTQYLGNDLANYLLKFFRQ